MYTSTNLRSTAPVVFPYDHNYPDWTREGETAVRHFIQEGDTRRIRHKFCNDSDVSVLLNYSMHGNGNLSHGLYIACFRMRPDTLEGDTPLKWVDHVDGESVHLRIAPFTCVVIEGVFTGTRDGQHQITISDLFSNQGEALDGLKRVECNVPRVGYSLAAGKPPGGMPTERTETSRSRINPAPTVS